jgi:hypothetical protein
MFGTGSRTHYWDELGRPLSGLLHPATTRMDNTQCELVPGGYLQSGLVAGDRSFWTTHDQPEGLSPAYIWCVAHTLLIQKNIPNLFRPKNDGPHLTSANGKYTRSKIQATSNTNMIPINKDHSAFTRRLASGWFIDTDPEQ